MALDATLENDISPEMLAALQPRRSLVPDDSPEPHLYEKHGLAPGKVETDYSQRKSEREGDPIDPSNIPNVFHRNPNPPHINTTAPLGQRQGGYSQGVATGLFLRYFFEALGDFKYTPTKLLATKYEDIVKQKAKEKGDDLIQRTLREHRSDLASIDQWIAEDIKQGVWKNIPKNSLSSSESLMDTASQRVQEILRPTFKKNESVMADIKGVFAKLGSQDATGRSKDILRDIYSTLYRTVAKQVENGAVKAEELTGEYVTSQKLRISTSGKEGLRDLVRPNIAKDMRSSFYDYGMGGYSVALTSAYAGKVVVDMKRLFSEVVAYELDKNPEDVSTADIWKSNNGVVQETWKKWGTRNMLRLATDGIFFGRLLKPNVEFGKFGLVSKGLLIMQDLWYRRLTTFEKLTSFVESTIKPEDGLGTPVTSEKLVDLFQSFTVHNRPDMSFQSIVGNNASEEVRWDYARQIFDRMAELMNQSYSYKHDVRYDENFQPLAQSNFTLPAFIFMLGHDMIDPNNPNFTMARIEIASEYGVRAMKGAHKEFMAAQHLPEAEQLPVFNRVMAQFPEANVTWRSRSERLETAKKRGSAKEEAPLRPEDAPAIEHVNLEHAQHDKLESRMLAAGI